MAKVILGNHSSVIVPRQDRDNIRKFYGDVLGGKITKADPERDFLRLGENFYIGFLYGDFTDESEFFQPITSAIRDCKALSIRFVGSESVRSNPADAFVRRRQKRGPPR